MLPYGEAPFLCNAALSPFYFRVVEFLHSTTLHAHQMIMVRTFIEFKDGFA